MTKFLTVCATFLALLVSTVVALPQDHLAPAAHSDRAPNSLDTLAERAVARGILDTDAKDSENYGVPHAQKRQVHNADYGSDSGPSGNPQTAQQTTEAAASPTSTAGSTSGAAGASSKKRRDDTPTTDIDYDEEDDS